MTATSIRRSKTVGAYEAKTKFPALLDLVERGWEITITRHARNVARLVPADKPNVDPSIFMRLRALHSRISLGKGESARDLITAGRRI